MPNTYVDTDRQVWHAFARASRQYGIKLGIVALGTIVAAGTINSRGTGLMLPSLVDRVVASAPAHPVGFDVLKRTPANRIAPGGLDAGFEHERIAYWVNRLSTTLGGGFERSLGRMTQYTDMITAKLDAK